LTYDKSDLNQIARDILVTNMPSGFEFSEGTTSLKVQEVEVQKDNSLKAKANISASLLPKIPTDNIQTELAGKSLSAAQDLLRGERNIMGAEFQIESPFPLWRDKLPLKSSNIHITIASSY